MKEKSTRALLTLANQLGLHPSQFGLKEPEHLEDLPEEVYNDSESETIDALADEFLELVDLGDEVAIFSSDARDFAKMVEDLTVSKSAEEFESILGCYGSLGKSAAVRKYAALRTA